MKQMLERSGQIKSLQFFKFNSEENGMQNTGKSRFTQVLSAMISF
jgi:hypothetical protein